MSSISSRGRSLTPRAVGVVGGSRSRKRARSASRSSSRSLQRQDRHRAWSYGQNGSSKFFDPFPSSMRAIMRYSTTCEFNPTAGSTAHNLFVATSIFDPEYTAGGHQPYGHDTYQSIYNHYTVVKAVIKVTWTETVSVAALVGITMTDDPSVNSTYDTVREVKPTKMAVFASDGTTPTLTQTYDMREVFQNPGGPNQLRAAFGTSPLENFYFDVWAQANHPASDLGIVRALVNIVYYVECSELKDLGQS